MKRLTLEQLRVNHVTAAKLLAVAVGRAYPIGSDVWVKRGRGRMLAQVSNKPSWWADPTRLMVVSAHGGKHHSADYADCTLIAAEDSQ